MKQRIYLPILFILFSVCCFAEDNNFNESVLSENGKQAYQILLKIQLFAIDGIGYSGRIEIRSVSFGVKCDLS